MRLHRPPAPARRPVARRVAAAASSATLLAGTLLLAAPAATAAAATHAVTPSVGANPPSIRLGKPSTTLRSGTHGKVLFTCQTPDPGDAQCYGPDQMRAAYGVDALIAGGNDGAGRTIVIVDAFSPPTVASDLATFDQAWGLPDPALSIVAPQGATPFDPTDANQVGWSGEIALDVQWAHSIAPAAKIVLVEAKTNEDADILAATKYAVDNDLGDVISQSFGEDERCVAPAILSAQHALFAKATKKKITLVASSGDQGSAQPTCDSTSYSKAVSSPAVDPYVLGVGGTRLVADGTSGKYKSESVWNESLTYGAAGGGGFSTIYARPSYQKGSVTRVKRGVPDVAYNAAIDGGVITYWGTPGAPNPPGFYLFGGTSAGTPQWAAIVALTDQRAGGRVGQVNQKVYAALSSGRYADLFHDVKRGGNGYTYTDDAGATHKISGYSAYAKWDPTTGVGTPKAGGLVPYLAGTD